MPTAPQILQLALAREAHLALLRDHAEQPDGSCACGDPQHPCIWALAALLGIDQCDRRRDAIDDGVGQVAAASPLALRRVVMAA